MSCPEHPSVVPLYTGDIINRHNLFRFIREFIRSSDFGQGYYMEFGVLNGKGIIDAYRQLRGQLTYVYGFDSFEGLPDLSEEDKIGAEMMPIFYKGNFKSMDFEFVRENIISSCRIPREKLTLVKGFFSDTLPAFDISTLKDKGDPICIYIDCDLYSATKEVLHFIQDIIVTGTWILLDDYWCYRGSPKFGQRRAFEEWLNSNTRIGVSEYGNFLGFGKAFIAYEK